MVALDFEGWFQCRLATNPALYDSPHGLGGCTFAVGSDPNLDRFIRLQPPIASRSFGLTIRVTVRTVTVDGIVPPTLQLAGAAVQLLDGARFEGCNQRVADAAAGNGSPLS